jgi:hypothetical protein
VEVFHDGSVLHLALFSLADAERRLTGGDDLAFSALKAKYADVLCGAPPGLPQERGMGLVIETGDTRMQRSHPVKRLSEGELAELRAQLVDLLDSRWIQHSESTAGHAVSVVFARKPDGTWRICSDYQGLVQPAGGGAAPALRRAARRDAGIALFHKARSGRQLPSAAGAGLG